MPTLTAYLLLAGVAAAAAPAGPAPAPAATPPADAITLKGGATAEGVFEEFRNGRFCFRARDGAVLREPRLMVESLELRPPARVVVKPQGRREIEDLRLKSYRDAAFVFDRGGEETTLRASEVSAIRMGLDFERAAASQPDAAGGAAGEALPDDVSDLARKGVVTIVHFHVEGLVPSVRGGNYADALAGDSRGRVVVRRVTLKDLTAPEAARFGIASVPQFWFYDRNGKLAVKLTDRFTSADIEDALKKTKR